MINRASGFIALPDNMKSSLLLLSLACTTFSAPVFVADGEQNPFYAGLRTDYPGFTLVLDAQRLVQIEGGETIWMTEMDKVSHTQLSFIQTCPFIAQVRAKAKGVNFFDM